MSRGRGLTLEIPPCGSQGVKFAVGATHAAKTLGVPSGQAPGAMQLILPAEVLTRWRITAGGAAISHGGQL